MKIATLLGTRPEIIRLSQIIRQLDKSCDHVLVHTGQNYDSKLSEIFFHDLGVRKPDFLLGIQADPFAAQIAEIMARGNAVLEQVRPDRVLVLGDTNTGLLALIAARMGIPVYHMEAGNRCYDDRVPEEINRRVIDHCSTVLMPYTQRSKENLVREGIERHRIFVTGNPIFEVLQTYSDRIEQSDVVQRFGLRKGEFFLATLHRAENVDTVDKLLKFWSALSLIAESYEQPVVLSLHPRTRERLQRFEVADTSSRVVISEPMGLFDFIQLEKNARCVLTDSGTVQEECCIFRVPNVTLRDVTERPETIEIGSNILSGSELQSILAATQLAISSPRTWNPPPEYLEPNVTQTVIKILLGYDHLADGYRRTESSGSFASRMSHITSGDN
ncbi:MAG: UDP-N-acetylglucosamine 2-epimerase (non-hydrolyzing) [Terracidiphilus sp.]|jgi:UDP-N-acetylglucosamine 2-epimerase (non-hydrolysing)